MSEPDALWDRVVLAAFDVDGAWDAADEDGAPILWHAEAGEVLADLRTAIEALDDDRPWYSVLREADTPIRTVTTPDGKIYHADQCALAPDHSGPCAWVGGRRPEDPVYPNPTSYHVHAGEWCAMCVEHGRALAPR